MYGTAESHRAHGEAESDDEDDFDYERYQTSKLADSRRANSFGGPEIHSNHGSDLRRTVLKNADRRFSVTDHHFSSERGHQMGCPPCTSPPSSEQSATDLQGSHDNHSSEVTDPPDYQFPTSSGSDGTPIAQGTLIPIAGKTYKPRLTHLKEAIYRAKIEALRPDPEHVKAVENSYKYDYRKATGYDLKYATRERKQTEFDKVEEQFYRRYPEAADR
ncbi:hypothetical protein I203_107516 [Kwoniella mangroviensis CBS 8507]|uniref:hypothetical protein n=1 Tax=Kwoniella mangroviensis CBS 8507 TaxID=1296122 RepID=UPI00080CFF9E|nr:uncharacterized protein I203_02268 [Kwoniella mangroviensis CBS 8507]OCF68876.1 hypothetical protein I203_02268 [Kwoniella mangroviensis CBS 8507]